MLQTAWTLARKDLVLFFRDRIAVVITLALPILLATVFASAMGGMMGGGSGATPKIRLLVQDDDGSAASAKLVSALEGAGGLRVERTEAGEAEVKNGEAPAALVIPSGYGAAADRGEVPRVRLLRDPAQSIAQQVIAGNLLFTVGKTTVELVGRGLLSTGLDGLDFPSAGRGRAEEILQDSWDSFDSLYRDLGEQGALDESSESGEPAAAASEAGEFHFLEDLPRLLGVDAEDVAGAEEDGLPKSAGVGHAIAAMAVMMLMFSLVAAGGTLLEEQAGGTLERLRLTPAGGGSILLGKVLSIVVIGLLQLFVLFLFGWLAFDVPVPQHLPVIASTSIALCLAVAGMGMVFATACRSQKQLEGVSTVIILVMSAVGGAWFPREVTPEWFQDVGRFTITAWAMDAYHGALWYGKGLFPRGDLDGVALHVGVLLGIAALLFAVAFALYKRRFDTIR